MWNSTNLTLFVQTYSKHILFYVKQYLESIFPSITQSEIMVVGKLELVYLLDCVTQILEKPLGSS